MSFHACDKKCSVKLSNFNVLTAKLPIFFPFRWSFYIAYTSEEVFVLVGGGHQWLFQSTNKAEISSVAYYSPLFYKIKWQICTAPFVHRGWKNVEHWCKHGIKHSQKQVLVVDRKIFSFSLATKGFDGPMEYNYFNLMCGRVQ